MHYLQASLVVRDDNIKKLNDKCKRLEEEVKHEQVSNLCDETCVSDMTMCLSYCACSASALLDTYDVCIVERL